MINSYKTALERNIWVYWIFAASRNACFFLPIYVLFIQKMGFGLTEVMLLQSIFAFSIMLLEVPTGYLADLIGRKFTLFWSGLFWIVGMMSYALGSTFFQFVFGEIMCAVSAALISGANSAFVYDSLKELRRESEYKKVWGNASFYAILVAGLATIVGGFIGAYNFRITFAASAVFGILAILLSLAFTEPKGRELRVKGSNMKEILRIAKYVFIENRQLRWLVVFFAIVMGINKVALWTYSPYMELTGLNIAYFGFVFASFQVFSAIMSKYAHTIESKLGRGGSLVALVAMSGIGYILMGKVVFAFSFVFAYFMQSVRSFGGVVHSDYVNKLAPSESRATILSFDSLVFNLVYALILPVAGWMIDAFSLLQALSMMGMIVLGFGIIMIFILKMEKAF